MPAPARPPQNGAPRPPRQGTAQNLEIAVGGLAALSFLTLVVTVWAELTGRNALTSALLLLLLLIVTYLTWRAWQRAKAEAPTRRRPSNR